MKTLRLAGTAALLVAVGALAFASASVAAPSKSSSSLASVPISFTDPTGTLTFSGTLDVTNFVAQNGVVDAVGTLTGTLTNTVTGVVTTITQDVVLPLLSASGSCTILHLELGPLDVNLLGLMVHLDKVVLDVSGQAGPGNLLGNLVCGVANALNSNIAATALANLLNNLLGLV
jgi:hypothetical protein